MIVSEANLNVPHAMFHQRAFVLRPMADIEPNFVVPGWSLTVQQLFDGLSISEKASVTRVMPIGDVVWRWPSRTFIMGIVCSRLLSCVNPSNAGRSALSATALFFVFCRFCPSSRFCSFISLVWPVLWFLQDPLLFFV